MYRRDWIKSAIAAQVCLQQSWGASRPRVAAIVTEYRQFSHGQHIVDRLLDGYGWNGEYHRPAVDLVSLYVDLHPKGDLTFERAGRFPAVKVVPTIAEALTLGTGKLAVDGVVIVGEHGNYPKTEKGQVQYPRYDFWRQAVDVFRSSGKVVPIFNDKHLSWKWEWAKQMYDDSKSLQIPFLAGSSLPVTWRLPSVEFPDGSEPEEAMCVCYGGVDSYDFHGLESIQCMVERRKGGESGVRWLQAYRGEGFWKAHADGIWPKELFEAALCRSHTMKPAREGFNDVFPSVEDIRRMVKNPVAYRYEHNDGLRCSMMLMTGLIEDFNFSVRIRGRKEIFSTQLYLPMPPARTSLASFFSPLVNHTEQMILSGVAPYPIERTLLTTGLTAAGVDSLYAGGTRLETPHLGIAYQAPKASTFWRT